tara:strand:+ start:257 stop:1120 length:864 start_codon:yes stop_codon:yes gene_type:complete
MGLLHLILNFVALLLWVHWRMGLPPQQASPKRSTGARVLQFLLRKALASISLILLTVVLLGRGWFYFAVAPDLSWQPHLDMVSFSLGEFQEWSLPFDRNVLEKQLAFSIVSFLPWLVVYNFCLVLLSVLRPDLKEAEGWNRFLRQQLGWLDWLPAVLKIPIAFLLAGCLFYASAAWMQRLEILTLGTNVELAHFAGDNAAVHLRHVAWFSMGLIVLYLFSNYVYFGGQNFWKCIEATGKSLLWVLQLLPLRWRKVDFAPLLGLALAFGVSVLLVPERMGWFYHRLAG